MFTVDAKGVITPVAEGTAKLTTKIKGGAYGDTYSVTTEISITPASTDSIDTPIVTNLEIKPKATADLRFQRCIGTSRMNRHQQ